MPRDTINVAFDVDEEHLTWLEDMADTYELPDVSAALRIVLDHAISRLDDEDVFLRRRR